MKPAFSAVFLTLCLVSAPACGPARIVRVPVAPEDIRQSNHLTRQGDELLVRREFYPALLKYLDAIRLNPNNEVILNKAAIVYTKLNLNEQAARAVDRALGLNPKYAYAYNTLGTLHLVRGDLGRAAKLFRKAIALRPDTAFFYKNLGTTLFEAKQFDKGMQAYRKAIELDPKALSAGSGINVESQASRGPDADRDFYFAKLYANDGNVDRAIEYLRKALQGGLEPRRISTEKDFDLIRGTEKFREFLQERGLALATAPPQN